MYAEYKNKSIYYEVHGEGTPLVILNGIMMSTKSWHMFLENLQDYKVILMDFLDQGNSDSCEDGYTHTEQVECVNAVLDALDIKKAYVVGVSYGAQVAMQFSIKYPSRVIRQVICNAGANTTLWLRDIGYAWKGAAKTYDPLHFYNVAIPYIYSQYFYNENAEWMNNRRSLLLNVFDKRFLDRSVRLINSSEDYDIRKELKDIDSPTLVVTSDCDYITPQNEGVYLHNNIKISMHINLEKCGHASMYEKPNEFIAIIKGFLNESKEVKVT